MKRLLHLAAKVFSGLLLLLTPALLYAQSSGNSLFGRKQSADAESQTAVAVQINPSKESFAGEWETPKRREVIVLNADGTGKETAFGQTGDCTWTLLAGGKMRINESFTEYMLSADGNALLRCSDGKKWSRADATSDPVAGAAVGEVSLQNSPFAGTRWRDGVWTYEFKADGTWTEWRGDAVYSSGRWKPEGGKRMVMTEGRDYRFEVSDDGQTLYRSDSGRWIRLDSQGLPVRPDLRLPGENHDFAGTKWRRTDEAGVTFILDILADGRFVRRGNQELSSGRWATISETQIEQVIPFGRHSRFTLSPDKKTMLLSDAGAEENEKWVRIENNAADSKAPTSSAKSEFDSFYFDNSTWGSSSYQITLSSDGTSRFQYSSGGETTSRWRQISPGTVLVGRGIQLKLSEDKMSVERTLTGSERVLQMSRIGSLPVKETATVKEYNALLEKYGETVNAALASRTSSENNKITALQSAAVRRGDATLAEKIKKVADELDDAKLILDDDIDKSASNEEAELLKFVQARNAAVYGAKKSALQRYRSEFEKILRQTIKTGEHDAGKMIEKFLLIEPVDENFFIGRWKNEKGVSYEFKRNKTCKRYVTGGDKVTYDSGRGKRSYTTSAREEDVGEWSFNHIKKELRLSDKYKNVTVFSLKDKQTIEARNPNSYRDTPETFTSTR